MEEYNFEKQRFLNYLEKYFLEDFAIKQKKIKIIQEFLNINKEYTLDILCERMHEYLLLNMPIFKGYAPVYAELSEIAKQLKLRCPYNVFHEFDFHMENKYLFFGVNEKTRDKNICLKMLHGGICNLKKTIRNTYTCEKVVEFLRGLQTIYNTYENIEQMRNELILLINQDRGERGWKKENMHIFFEEK